MAEGELGEEQSQQETDLPRLFQKLERPPHKQDNQFAAAEVPGTPSHRVAKDSDGRPLFLLGISAGSEASRLYPVLLENISLQYDVECRISKLDGTADRGSFAVLRCLSDKVGLHEHFLRVGGMLLNALGSNPDEDRISQNLSSLVELFSALSKRPRTSVQGLWAELFLISASTDVRRCLKAWHVEPGERFDLAEGSQRVEIKSYSGPVRRHAFSHEQLNPPGETDAVVASVQTVSATGGLTIAAIIDVIRDRADLDSEAVLQLEEAVAKALGNEHEHGIRRGFDQELGTESCRFYSTDDIPKLGPDLPAGVTRVQFYSDLSRALPVTLEDATGLFAAVAQREV